MQYPFAAGDRAEKRLLRWEKDQHMKPVDKPRPDCRTVICTRKTSLASTLLLLCKPSRIGVKRRIESIVTLAHNR